MEHVADSESFFALKSDYFVDVVGNSIEKMNVMTRLAFIHLFYHISYIII